MTQEEKQLLLNDLCARLPYGVMMHVRYLDWSNDDEIKERDIELTCYNISYAYEDVWHFYKPYLRLMSSMTEEECLTLSKLIPYEIDAWKYIKTSIPLYIANIEQFDFFHRHYLDWRGLIPKGLALEAPEGMYKI